MSDITLGIIGSGQLGSLLCQAAKKLDVKTVVISDDEQGPAQNYSNEFIYSKYDNESKIKEFIDKVDIVTFEFENIPVDILKKIELKKKVLPKPEINKKIQNRKLEKTFINDLSKEQNKDFEAIESKIKEDENELISKKNIIEESIYNQKVNENRKRINDYKLERQNFNKN